MRYSINPEDRQLLEGYLNSMLESGNEIPQATFNVAMQFIGHGSCDQAAFNELFANEMDDNITQLLTGFNYGEIQDDGYAPYDEDQDPDYLAALALSERQSASEAAIREALARDDELRFQLALQQSELQEDAAEGSDAGDTEPAPLPIPVNLPQPQGGNRHINWGSASRYLAQTLHFSNPAAQGSIQARSDEHKPDTYLGNEAL